MRYHAVNEVFSSVTQSAKWPCCEWSVSIGHTVCNMTTLRMKCFYWSVQSLAVKRLSRLVTKLITKPRYEWSVSIGHEAHYNITQSVVRFDSSSSLQRHHAVNGDVWLVTKLSTMECFDWSRPTVTYHSVVWDLWDVGVRASKHGESIIYKIICSRNKPSWSCSM